MTAVVVTPTAAADLDRLITTQSFPPDTRARFQRSVASLTRIPMIGAPLHGRWSAYRFLLGPWRWMIVVYVYDAPTDRVAIVTIQDARSGRAATSG
jgi:plasmid stabilization system protein ParE